VYPALVVLQALRELELKGEQVKHTVLWIGGESGMEEDLLAREGIDFVAIPAAGVHGVGLKNLPGNILKLVEGFLKARRIVRKFQPDVLFFTGGYLAVPVALAGISRPSAVFVPDIKPGLALRTIAALTDLIAVSVEKSQAFFRNKKQVRVTGYPVRKQLLAWSREEAFLEMQLDPGVPTLLVLGGSTGARSINQAVSSQLADLLPELQIIHVSGNRDYQEMHQKKMLLAEHGQQRYRLYSYLHDELGAALRCADVVLSRAGASILGEYPRFGLPAIVVPYPHAWDYQMRNARYLKEHGAAEILLDENLPEQLVDRVLSLIRNRQRREDMTAAMRSLSRPQAAERIAALLLQLAGEEPGRRKP